LTAGGETRELPDDGSGSRLHAPFIRPTGTHHELPRRAIMSFDEIRQTITDAWAFVFTPVFRLAVLALITALLAREPLRDLRAAVSQRRLTSAQRRKLKRTWATLGLNKLTPLVALFGIVSALHVSNWTIVQASGWIPGNVVYRPDLLLLRTLAPERLGEVWARYPNARSLQDVRGIVDQEIRTVEATDSTGITEPVERWRVRANTEAGNFFFVKFLLAWTFLLVAIRLYRGHGLRPILLPLALVLFALAGWGAVSVANHLFALEQTSFAEGHVLTTMHNLKHTTPPDTLVFKRRLEELGRMREGREPWWEFQPLDLHNERWTIDVLLGERR
jgi:hypothetical protein